MNHGTVVRINIFDRVFNGQYMAGSGLVDVVNHGCQGGGLTASGRTGNQDKSSGHFGKLSDYIGQTKLGKCGNFLL